MDALPGFVLAGFALAGSPGPATLSLAAAGAAFGARRSLGYMAGLVVGLLAVMGIAATGAIGVLLAVPGAKPLVIGAAAAYFVYLAVRIAMAPPLRASGGDDRRPSFAGGLFLSLINPKGYAAMAALFSGFALVGDRLVLDALLKAAVLLAIVLAVNVAWLLLGAALTRLFCNPRSNRTINVAFAVLLLASVAAALLF